MVKIMDQQVSQAEGVEPGVKSESVCMQPGVLGACLFGSKNLNFS